MSLPFETGCPGCHLDCSNSRQQQIPEHLELALSQRDGTYPRAALGPSACSDGPPPGLLKHQLADRNPQPHACPSSFTCTYSQKAWHCDKLNGALHCLLHARCFGKTVSAESEATGGINVATKHVSRAITIQRLQRRRWCRPLGGRRPCVNGPSWHVHPCRCGRFPLHQTTRKGGRRCRAHFRATDHLQPSDSARHEEAQEN